FHTLCITCLYTYSLHDALPISGLPDPALRFLGSCARHRTCGRLDLHRYLRDAPGELRLLLGTDGLNHRGTEVDTDVSRLVFGEKDRKSTRLNSSHVKIS